MSEVMRRPTHPGEILKEDVLPAIGLSQEEFAAALKLSRKTVNEILGGKAPVTAETAVKLSHLFENDPKFWLNLQSAYDIWAANDYVQRESIGSLKHLLPVTTLRKLKL